jgi:hypothetical protein
MYRRDLELAPGAEFRLRRRFSPKSLSFWLALAAVAFAGFDLYERRPWVGVITLLLSLAFVAENYFDGWRVEGRVVVHRALTLRGPKTDRLPAAQIRGVHVAFDNGRARAFIETIIGEEIPLVEGPEASVRQIADRLSDAISNTPRLLH